MKGLINADRLLEYLKGFKPNGYYDYILNIVLRDIGGTGQSQSGSWGH